MKHKIILLAIAAFAALEVSAARPRLVVNIVVGSMRAEDLSRYADNYGEGGLRRLIDGGTVFADSRYDYQQTTTPVSLADVRREKIAAVMARGAAKQTARLMSRDEAAALLARLAASGNFSFSPSGKAITAEITVEDIRAKLG